MKVIKKSFYILLLMSVLLLGSGCWDKMEPKELAVIHSIIYNINEDGQTSIIAEIMNPSKTGSDGAGDEQCITVVAEGQSAREAISHLAFNVEKHTFAGHNKVRFFSETFAKNDMAAVMDFFLRDHLIDETPLMIVIKNDTPEDIHIASAGLSDIIGDYFEDLSKIQPLHSSKSVFVTTLDFVKDYLSDGKQPVAGVAKVIPSPNVTKAGEDTGDSGQNADKIVIYEGLAVFKDNKLVGYMDGVETRAYNILVNDLGVSVASIPSDDGLTTFLLSTSNADINTVVDKQEITIDIKINISLRIIEESGTFDITQKDWLSQVEYKFNEWIIDEIAATIKKAQEMESDIFGFGNHVHKQHPFEWRQLKENWDAFFSAATVKITVDSSVYRTGQIKQPLQRSKEYE